MVRANPKNVPLDLADPESDPYPYPFEDSSLSQEERERRWKAIKEHRKTVPSYSSRMKKADDEYIAIIAEILRGISERVTRIQSSGLLDDSIDSKMWILLGKEVANLTRESIAGQFANAAFALKLYNKQVTTKLPFKRGDFDDTETRDAFEVRASLIERWVIARSVFEARPEVMGARAVQGLSQRVRARARNAAVSVLTEATKGQADIVAGNNFHLTYRLADIRSGIGGILDVFHDKDLGAAFENFTTWQVRSIESRVKKAEKLAGKGESRHVSRKLSKAEEARLDAIELARENPFAGYKGFKACVRAKSRDPKVYSPGGLCASIERRARGNPVHPVPLARLFVITGVAATALWLAR
jgi:hypothetical protein